MNKLAPILLTLVFLASAGTALAQSTTGGGPGAACSDTNPCNSTSQCNKTTGRCELIGPQTTQDSSSGSLGGDPSIGLPSSGFGKIGDPCASNTSCDTASGYTCDIATNQCVYSGTSASGGGATTPGSSSGSASDCTPACGTGYTCVLGTCKATLDNPSVPAKASGTGFVPIAGIPGLTDNAVASESGLATFLNNLYKYLIGLAAILAIIQIIRGGLEIATESVAKHAEGRKHIQEAILGLVLILMPALIFSLINPTILNLSVQLPPLNTKSGNATATNGSSASQTTTTASGVTQQINGTYLLTGTFTSNDPDANNQAAQDWVAQCNTQGALWAGVEKTSSCDVRVNGKCQSQSSAIAQCVAKPSVSAKFVDVETGIFGTGYGGIDYSLKPVDTSGTQYLAACAADNGVACTQSNPGSAETCPPNTPVPDAAPNSKNGGNCYTMQPICATSITKSSLCPSKVSFTTN